MSSDDGFEPEVKTHQNRRLLQIGQYEGPAPIDVQTQQANELIEAMHRRLLETATAGRLTWCDDRIIRRVRLASDPDASPADQA